MLASGDAMRVFGFVRTLLPAVVIAGSLAGCAADTGSDPESTDSDSEELRLASGYRYKCTRTVGTRVEHVAIALTSKAEGATFVWTFDDGRTRVGHYGHDPSYAPKTNASYARYNSGGDGFGTPDSILAYKPMMTGAASGSIKLQSGGDAFSSAYYHCARTTSSINTGEPKRHAASAAVAALANADYYGDPQGGLSPDQAAHTVYSVFMKPDGSYYAYNTDATVEMGVWKTSGTTLPLAIAFQSGSYTWSGTLGVGKLAWTRGDLSGTLTTPP